jgi:hypothetical protein
MFQDSQDFKNRLRTNSKINTIAKDAQTIRESQQAVPISWSSYTYRKVPLSWFGLKRMAGQSITEVDSEGFKWKEWYCDVCGGVGVLELWGVQYGVRSIS